MSTENEKPRQAVAKVPLRAGGNVLAIIPQDIDQVWRMARMAVIGRMAPKSLVDQKSEEEATASCAIAIMAGAELGLSPLMALRSYAVVNGRPSLWGDGIKAVVRQSGKCDYIRTGGDFTKGWCEARRSDNGEEKRVEFTWEQAKKAGLAIKKGPWTDGYADMMMERRATFRCLNDLFADVLGGLADAQDPIPDDDAPMHDITPRYEAREIAPPDVPDVPMEEDATEPSEATGREDGGQGQAFNVVAYLDRLGEELSAGTTVDEVEAIFDGLNVQVTLGALENDDPLKAAFALKLEHMARVKAETFPGDLPAETQQAIKNVNTP